MSNAAEKNALALKALFGDEALASRLSATRIAVVTPNDELPVAGKLLAEVLADVLARFWPNIDFVGAYAEQQFAIASDAAKSGKVPIDGLGRGCTPSYHCVVAVGPVDIPEAAYVVQVGANGWIAELGEGATCGDSINPVGSAFAAAMAAAQVFRHVFASELASLDIAPLESCSVDLRQLFDAPDLEEAPIDLGETHIFGVGAVTHGLVKLLEHWPDEVTGTLHLVDQDCYGDSNGQRYAFMLPRDLGISKVDAVRERLQAAHPNAVVSPHSLDLNTYCAERGYDEPLYRVIAGLDSAEARRHVALKLPERVVNMWTEGIRIGAGRYLSGAGRACLACDYLEKIDTPLDEVAEIHKQTNIRPDLVRTLLDSGRGLTQQEAIMVASHRNVPVDQFVGQPLRSVLPVLCATGRIQMPNNPDVVDVPFAFASLFAGIAGFMMLLKDCLTPSLTSYSWTQHVFKKPTLHMHQKRHSRKECVCCSEMVNLEAESS